MFIGNAETEGLKGQSIGPRVAQKDGVLGMVGMNYIL